MAAGDLDGDGADDLAVAQAKFSQDPQRPLFFQGEGRGGFARVAPGGGVFGDGPAALCFGAGSDPPGALRRALALGAHAVGRRPRGRAARSESSVGAR